ncbi:MAG: alpha-amylase family glycosyl hydrolase [Bacteroidetes bacterium]|nr:alpha-amylase family glycosyl hydrolase [Bacteroidota bacterium]
MPWYHHTTMYQIYPRSFYDSNDDGIGDIQGIIQKLDYIKSIGYETIWCSPFFKSPQQDFGYDISDYCDIAPEYGTLADAQQLIDEVHKRGMKIVFDMVMNHTSVEHPWFIADITHKTQEDRQTDFYIWSNKPNNWKSMTGGSGWHYSPDRKQYYWASFLPFQPDLNYRNPEVKKAMLDNVRFWLRKGVDGFRLDIFNVIYKDEQLRDNPFSWKAIPDEKNPDGFFQQFKYTINQPESMAFAKELRSVCNEFDEKVLLGEVSGNRKTIRKFSGEKENDGLGLVFDFEMLPFKFNSKFFHELVRGIETDFPEPFMPVYVFSNHDRRRSMKRLNNDVRKAKLLHLFQLTMRGVPCMYYGEEIGMTDSRIPFKKGLDPIAQKMKKVPRFLFDLAGETPNRDELRTPMQWNSSVNAGFSSAEKTWLPVHTNFTNVNVEKEMDDETSLLKVVQQVLKIRKEMPAIHSGTLELMRQGNLPSNVLAYKRKMEGEEVLVVLNFSKAEKEIALSEKFSNVLFSSSANEKFAEGKIHLSAYGTVILKK